MAGIQCGLDTITDTMNMYLIGCETDDLVIGTGAGVNLFVSEDTVYSTIDNIGGNLFEWEQ